MKICEKCGCVYDDSFDKCPTCNKTFEQELGAGCLNGVVAGVAITLSIVKMSIIPFVCGIVICLIISIKLNKNKLKDVKNEQTNSNESKQQPIQQAIKTITDISQIEKYYSINSKNDTGRILRAKYETFTFQNLNKENKTAEVLNQSKNNVYHTTLTSCTCQDFIKRNLPCKHMYRLAAELEIFPLYKAEEQELILKLQAIKDNSQLISKLIDVFFRIRDKKNKYYTKTSPLLNELADLKLISINEIPIAELINFKYNTNELKGILADKGIKMSASKKELIEIFQSDEKLIKKLPKNLFHITLNCTETQKEYYTEPLYYYLNN